MYQNDRNSVFSPHLSIATRFAPLLMCKRSWKKACCLNACSLFRVISSWRNSPSWLTESRRPSLECPSFWLLRDPLAYPSPHFPAPSSCATFSRPPRANGDSARSQNGAKMHRVSYRVSGRPVLGKRDGNIRDFAANAKSRGKSRRNSAITTHANCVLREIFL